MILIAPTGSGKNATIQSGALLEYEGSALVIDPKGQLAAITAEHRNLFHEQEIFALNPFGVLGIPSASYNPLRFVDPASHSFFSDCKRIAEGLVDIQTADHWETSALDVVTLLIMWTVLHEEVKDLVTVRRLLNQHDQDRIVFFENMMGCDTPALAEGAARFALKDTEVRNCIQNAVNKLSFLRDPGIERVIKAGGPREISFADLKRKGMTVYLIIPPELLHTHGRFLRLMVMSALGELIKEPSKPAQPVLFMLDEFAQLGPMPIIENAASIVREYSVKLWLILQNLPQLKTLYGNKWESFLSAAGIVQFFTPNDLETAKYVSERSGIQIKMRLSEGYSRSTNTGSTNSGSTSGTTTSTSTNKTEHEAPLLSIQDIFGMSSHLQVMLCPGIEQAMVSRRFNYWDVYGKKADPDPYHMTAERRAKYDDWIRSGETPFDNITPSPEKRIAYRMLLDASATPADQGVKSSV